MDSCWNCERMRSSSLEKWLLLSSPLDDNKSRTLSCFAFQCKVGQMKGLSAIWMFEACGLDAITSLNSGECAKWMMCGYASFQVEWDAAQTDNKSCLLHRNCNPHCLDWRNRRKSVPPNVWLVKWNVAVLHFCSSPPPQILIFDHHIDWVNGHSFLIGTERPTKNPAEKHVKWHQKNFAGNSQPLNCACKNRTCCKVINQLVAARLSSLMLLLWQRQS